MAEKKLPESAAAKRVLIEPGHSELSIRQQCDLLGLNRATYYYQPATESELNLTLMALIDKEYTEHPLLDEAGSRMKVGYMEIKHEHSVRCCRERSESKVIVPGKRQKNKPLFQERYDVQRLKVCLKSLTPTEPSEARHAKTGCSKRSTRFV